MGCHDGARRMKAHWGALGSAAQGGAKEQKNVAESERLETKVKLEGWRSRVMSLVRRANRSQRTTVELGAWKTEVEPVGVRMTAKGTEAVNWTGLVEKGS